MEGSADAFAFGTTSYCNGHIGPFPPPYRGISFPIWTVSSVRSLIECLISTTGAFHEDSGVQCNKVLSSPNRQHIYNSGMDMYDVSDEE